MSSADSQKPRRPQPRQPFTKATAKELARESVITRADVRRAAARVKSPFLRALLAAAVKTPK